MVSTGMSFKVRKLLTICGIVLGQKKDASLNKNSKTYNQDKWDQEVRDSIAKKKAAASGGTLSKQDQALVDSQLAQESKIRLKLESLQRSLCTSLDVIQSMLNARSEVFDRHLPEALSLVISQAVGPAAFLAGERACSLYLVSAVAIVNGRLTLTSRIRT